MGKFSIKFKRFFLPSNDIANCIAVDLNTIIIFLRVFHLYRAASMLGVVPFGMCISVIQWAVFVDVAWSGWF